MASFIPGWLFLLSIATCVLGAESISVIETWGSDSSESSLATYCQTNQASMFAIDYFDTQSMNLSISNSASGNYSSLGSQIQYCQSLGKEIFLIVGAKDADLPSSYSSSLKQALSPFYDQQSSTHPFGKNVNIDGVILRGTYDDTSSTFVSDFISSASGIKVSLNVPCQKDILDNSNIANSISNVDFVIVDYSYSCAIKSDDWSTYNSFGPSIFIGLDVNTADYAYHTPEEVTEAYSYYLANEQKFAGFSLNDAYYAVQKLPQGYNYEYYINRLSSAGVSASASASAASSDSQSTYIAPSTTNWRNVSIATSSAAEIETTIETTTNVNANVSTVNTVNTPLAANTSLAFGNILLEVTTSNADPTTTTTTNTLTIGTQGPVAIVNVSSAVNSNVYPATTTTAGISTATPQTYFTGIGSIQSGSPNVTATTTGSAYSSINYNISASTTSMYDNSSEICPELEPVYVDVTEWSTEIYTLVIDCCHSGSASA
ncbi:hypothetical protein DASB73_009740 [Starmerella bacillaris]|uniref:1,3-beta-glucanosyltransferase n=1 Tax=Starmerella bacillaris TaxID=1247836 RepID=A0AAV5RFP3_STABA|nr:hypothetical protein DASB73_009740 [Starmerella bacillaris]